MKPKSFYKLYAACLVILFSVFVVSIFAANQDTSINSSSFAETLSTTITPTIQVTYTNPVYKTYTTYLPVAGEAATKKESLSPYSLLAWSSLGVAILMIIAGIIFLVLKKKQLIEISN